MWVIFRKRDQTIVGMSANCELDLDKEYALKEVVNGLVDSGPLEEFDAIQVTDREQAGEFMRANPNHLVLKKGRGDKLKLVVEEPKKSMLLLQSDAPDVHPVDSIPEISADGESFTTIEIRKVDEFGKPQIGRNDNDLLYLRTDYGSIYSEDGTETIRSIKLTKGQAAFRLVSEKLRRIATIQVFNADANLLDGSIRIEFI